MGPGPGEGVLSCFLLLCSGARVAFVPALGVDCEWVSGKKVEGIFRWNLDQFSHQ